MSRDRQDQKSAGEKVQLTIDEMGMITWERHWLDRC
jgi:hypothetical protein